MGPHTNSSPPNPSPINASLLQKLHKDAYQKLFARCPVVTSAPLTIDLGPPMAERYGGIGISVKLGLRLYVGLEPIASASPKLGQVSYYLPEESRFVDILPDKLAHLEERLLQGVERGLKTFFSSTVSGVRINVLSEVPFFRGLPCDACWGVALAVALGVWSGNIHALDVEKFSSLPSKELLGDRKFQTCYSLAWCIEEALSVYRPAGHSIFSMLVQASEPVIFWRHAVPLGVDWQMGREKAFDFQPCGCRLSELHDKNANTQRSRSSLGPLSSLDAALVYVGRETDSEEAYSVHRNGFRAMIDLEVDSLKKTLNASIAGLDYQLHDLSKKQGIIEMGTNDSRILAPRFTDFLTDESKNTNRSQGPADIYLDSVVLESLRVLHSLLEIGAKKTPNSVRGFILAMDRCNSMYEVMNLLPGFIEEARHTLRLISRKMCHQRVAVRLQGPGRGGYLSVWGARGTLRSILPSIILNAQSVLDPGGTYIHALWLDESGGYATAGRGVFVEQVNATRNSGTARSFVSFSKRQLRVMTWKSGRLSAPKVCSETFFRKSLLPKTSLVIEAREDRVLIWTKDCDPNVSTSDSLPEKISRNIGLIVLRNDDFSSTNSRDTKNNSTNSDQDHAEKTPKQTTRASGRSAGVPGKTSKSNIPERAQADVIRILIASLVEGEQKIVVTVENALAFWVQLGSHHRKGRTRSKDAKWSYLHDVVARLSKEKLIQEHLHLRSSEDEGIELKPVENKTISFVQWI